MEIGSFDDLKRVALEEGAPQRLMVLLLHAEPDEAGDIAANGDSVQGRGTLSPVMATDLELTDELRLDVMVEEADSLGKPWDLLLVSMLCGTPGGPVPTSEEADPYLQEMAAAVVQGQDLSRFAVFDRSGSPVQLQVSDTGS